MPRRPLSEIFGQPGPMSTQADKPSWWSQSEPYVRPTLEGAGAALGGIAAGAAATPETLGTGTLPAAFYGGAIGYAGGKGLADLIYKKDIPATGNQVLAKPIKDIGAGAIYEMAGQGVGRALGAGARAVINPASAYESALMSGRAINNYINPRNVGIKYPNNPYIKSLADEGAKLAEQLRWGQIDQQTYDRLAQANTIKRTLAKDYNWPYSGGE